MKTAARQRLDAVESALLHQQADRRRRTKYDEADLPPMPADPTTCRWCGGKRRWLIEGDPKSDFCSNLCAPNDQAPYRNQCIECRREFHTGRSKAILCFECDEHEKGERHEHGPRMATRDVFGEMLRRHGRA